MRLLSEMRTAQQHLVDIADSSCVTFEVSAPSIEEFLAALRTAWKDGEVRPTARPKPAQKRGRRRPDPFAQVTGQLRSWFEAEPWRTGAERVQSMWRDRFRRPGRCGFLPGKRGHNSGHVAVARLDARGSLREWRSFPSPSLRARFCLAVRSMEHRACQVSPAGRRQKPASASDADIFRGERPSSRERAAAKWQRPNT